MEFIVWYLIIGTVVTCIHCLIMKINEPWSQFDLAGLLITVVVWPLLILYYLGKVFQR
jgi:hypothetical protein